MTALPSVSGQVGADVRVAGLQPARGEVPIHGYGVQMPGKNDAVGTAQLGGGHDRISQPLDQEVGS